MGNVNNLATNAYSLPTFLKQTLKNAKNWNYKILQETSHGTHIARQC